RVALLFTCQGSLRYFFATTPYISVSFCRFRFSNFCSISKLQGFVNHFFILFLQAFCLLYRLFILPLSLGFFV
ncbi:MAG: hypothetical protein R3Y47_09105, partial [Lachnospiraceae bacterium]